LAPGSARHVALIVEDDPQVREIVKRVLDMEGYVTHTASNGAKGLERFYLTLPDLIIMDVKMPEMDGWETLRALRQVSECPVMMLTVFDSTEDIVKGLELGADDYLVKPFGIQELTARVSVLLRRTSPVV
jgi:DNA-binding response OmpR family regulator